MALGKRVVLDSRAEVEMRRELEAFKAYPLPALAAHLGYEVDRRRSSRRSVVLRKGERVIVAAPGRVAWRYFAVGDTDHGTVIDLVQHDLGLGGLGEVRRVLRAWMGSTPPAVGQWEGPSPSQEEHPRVSVEVLRPLGQRGLWYLQQRGLRPETAQAFAPVLREEPGGCVAFLHRDQGGVTGWERRGAQIKGFSAGGRRGLCWMDLGGGDLLVTEAGVDMLSLYQLEGEGGVYVSTGGALSARQEDLLLWLAGVSEARRLVACTDRDDAGARMAAQLEALAARAGLRYLRHAPPAKDWNEALALALRLQDPRQQEDEGDESPSCRPL